MDWPEAVVAIIIIVTIGRVMRSKYRAEHGILEDRRGNAIGSQTRNEPQTERLQEEVRYLKERVAVLEKTRSRNYATASSVPKVEGQA